MLFAGLPYTLHFAQAEGIHQIFRADWHHEATIAAWREASETALHAM